MERRGRGRGRARGERNLGFHNRGRNPSSSSNKFASSSNTHSNKNNEESSTITSSIVGTCNDMCPVKERAQRERLRDLSVFERLDGNRGKTSPSLAVKKFCRTISTMDIQPSDVRPLQVLQDTLFYLFRLLDSSEHPFELVHDFIFDRTRAIRQDISMQNITSVQAIHMYEEMVKFHIVSQYKLPKCSDDPNISSSHLNMEQLSKCLLSLYDLYDASRKSNSINDNEAEFYSYYVLLHLDSESQKMGESLSLWLRHLTTPVVKSKEMCFARRMLRFFRMGNYKCFFSTIAAEASYLHYCLMEPLIHEVRLHAVTCINYAGYKLHPYPLEHLSKLLMMVESDMESLCNSCGFEISSDEAGNKLLPLKQTGSCRTKTGFQKYTFMGSERIQSLNDSFRMLQASYHKDS